MTMYKLTTITIAVLKTRGLNDGLRDAKRSSVHI